MDCYDYHYLTPEGKVLQSKDCAREVLLSYHSEQKDGWAFLNDSSTKRVIEISPGTSLPDLQNLLSRNVPIAADVREKLEEMVRTGKIERTVSYLDRTPGPTAEEMKRVFQELAKGRQL